jgi:phage FluMu protein Com
MHNGKCPKCEKIIVKVALQAVTIGPMFGGPEWLGVSYQCPSCQTVLSVGIDPVALKNDLVKELLIALRKA